MFFKLGIHNGECRNIVRIRCIGACPGNYFCDIDCKHKGYTRGECSPPPKYHDCCCVLN